MLSCLRKRVNSLSLLVALVASLPAVADNQTHTDILVEPAALPALLASRGHSLVLLDCRTRKEYEVARIENARWVDTSQLKSMSPARDAWTKQTTWATWFSAHGLDADSRVVIYDDGNMTDAARVWFLLQYQGVRRVSVLNGGFVEIKAMLDSSRIRSAAGPVSQPEETPARSPVVTGADSCPVGLADRNAARTAIDRTDTVILDVRTEAEFRGVDQEKNPRHGHIPHAVNIPHAQLFTQSGGHPATQPATRPKGRLKSAPELRKLFEKSGVTSDRRVVVHCQSGGRAALAALALVYAGYGDVSNYYASFGDWSADPDLPVLGPRPTTTPATMP